MASSYIGVATADRDPVVGNDTVTTSKIADDAVTTAKIADDQVTTAKIADDQVTTAKIADNNVTGPKIAMGSDATGDLMKYDGTNYARLPIGSAEQVLRVNAGGTDLEFADAVGGAAWALKTGNYTAVAGDGVMVDTSSTAITVTLPASAALGEFVRILDATGNAATNNITVARNGHNIQGSSADLTISTNRAAIGLVYVNVAQGWVLIEN